MNPALKIVLQRLSAPIGSTTRVTGSGRSVILTFDDGPRTGVTSEILEVLAEHGAGATFFVLLTRARLNPSDIASILEAGHEVALHGIDHRPMPAFAHRENLRRLRDGRRELEDMTGNRVRWMRPPYGRQRPQDWAAVRLSGMEPVMWTRTTWDTRPATHAERVAQAVRGARGGDILLAHDGYATEVDGVDDGPEPQLDRARLLADVLDGYRAEGLRGVSLEQALQSGRLERRAWFSR